MSSVWRVIIVCGYEKVGVWDDFLKADVISLDDSERSW